MMRLRFIAMLVALYLSGGAICQPTGHGLVQQLDRARLGWDRMELSASKFFVSMRVTMELGGEPGSGDGIGLTALDPSGSADGDVSGLGIRYVTDGLGRKSNVELLIDPGSGAALRRTSLETGGRNKYRQYLFGEETVRRLTRRPEDGEETRPATEWSRVSEEQIDYPDDARGVVTEAGALIYLIAASHLEQPGDSLEILTLASDEFHWVEATVSRLDALNLDYKEKSAASTKRRTVREKAIRIVLRSRPVLPGDDDRFELLGLRDIELFIDPRSRALLQLRGKVDYFGRITFSLDSIRLTSAPHQADTDGPESARE